MDRPAVWLVCHACRAVCAGVQAEGNWLPAALVCAVVKAAKEHSSSEWCCSCQVQLCRLCHCCTRHACSMPPVARRFLPTPLTACHLIVLLRAFQPTVCNQPMQGSITSWRANCASFASLGALSRLARLSLHAFHCPGAHLAAALLRLGGLEELRLSGRVVLEPLAALSRLGRLQVGSRCTHALACHLSTVHCFVGGGVSKPQQAGTPATSVHCMCLQLCLRSAPADECTLVLPALPCCLSSAGLMQVLELTQDVQVGPEVQQTCVCSVWVSNYRQWALPSVACSCCFSLCCCCMSGHLCS